MAPGLQRWQLHERSQKMIELVDFIIHGFSLRNMV